MTADLEGLDLSDSIKAKLVALQQKLGTPDLASALDKSLNITNFIAETVKDPKSKLLVENDGRFTEVTGFK